jgi:hypothetical protein
MPLAAGDVVRFTKNFVVKGGKCRNNDLATVQTVTRGEDTKRNLKHVGYLFYLVKARRKLLT